MRPKISVLINTLNEEKNIRSCLECLKWADEIIVVDMYSDDRTVEIASEYTEKIFMHERMGYADPARQFALDKATNNWVLVVDADELIPYELYIKLMDLAKEDRIDAVWIPRLNYFFGSAMKGSGWGALQDRQLRFFRKEMMKYGNRVHDFVRIDPSARTISISDSSLSILHFNYIDAEHFLDKLNRYTTIEAQNAMDAGESFSVFKLFMVMIKEFLNRFIRQKGYRDGFQGFALSFLMSTYRLSSGLKIYITRKYAVKGQVREKIERTYDEVAKQEIKKYGNNQ